ncbi:MAG: biotin--[acetyl-CoA-carboxylase] ligase [Nocardioides sp.]|nr:biotin--[acetyl-CoA-carboxylase] ligase [Nocardioides sp.]
MTESPAPRPPLDPERLPDRVEILGSATSTNAVLAERARAGADAGLVVVAEAQEAGRGRLDRSWEVPPYAALTFSVLIRPDIPPTSWPWLPLMVGYAVHAALVDRMPGLGLKWPNDLLVDEERKVCGILVERVETPTGPAAVVGIGLNVSQTHEELPVEAATSLFLEVEGNPDRSEVLDGILGSLEALTPLLEDIPALQTAYSSECVTLGRRVRVEVPSGEPFSGTAMGLDESGRLVVETEGGLESVGAGDVVHVRRTDL